MTDREILDHLLKSAQKDHKYFSNVNKEVRERWVVSQFLTVIEVQHQEKELLSLEQSNKADVQFRDANFQVKELTDPDLRRGKMYKDAYNSIKNAKSLKEVSLISDVRDLPPVANMFELVFSKAEELARSNLYKDVKKELDLLIYVTRTRASLIQPHELDSAIFSNLGWRSISCVNTKQAVVLFSSPLAPDFVQNWSQKLMKSSN